MFYSVIKIHFYFFIPILLVDSEFFRNFVRFRILSLSKGSLGDWRKTGLRFGNRTQFHILLWNALNEHPMMCHQPFLWLIIGCKVTNKWAKYQIFEYFRTRELELVRLACPRTSRHRLKGNHSFWKNQIYSHLFLLSLLNTLELIAASFVAPARKVRIRLRPITQYLLTYRTHWLHSHEFSQLLWFRKYTLVFLG